MVKIAINGICGKMGKRILRLAQKDREVEVVVGFEQDGHPESGSKIEGVKIASDYLFPEGCDCIIDFTSPAGTTAVTAAAKKEKKSLIIGTTGLGQSLEEEISEAAKGIPVVYSPNMSVGINLFFKVLKLAAVTLKDYQVKMKEAHHIHKKDAPSGTAKKLAQIVNELGPGINIKDIDAKREGEIIGDHEVAFESNLDSFTISHHAKTRDIFAQGAVTAAKWIKAKPAGLYSMEDVLFNRA